MEPKYSGLYATKYSGSLSATKKARNFSFLWTVRGNFYILHCRIYNRVSLGLSSNSLSEKYYQELSITVGVGGFDITFDKLTCGLLSTMYSGEMLHTKYSPQNLLHTKNIDP